jgi:hypothetical protein
MNTLNYGGLTMMSGQVSAEIGHWYKPINQGHLFEVVAIDYDEQTIEIQDFDGSIDELEFVGWKAMIPIEIAPPEDWTGPFELDSEEVAFNAYALDEALRQLKG